MTGLNNFTMISFTCKNTMQHKGLWAILAIESFAPVYPTSFRGTNDNQSGYRGTE
jgi:hypothetical protein